MTNTIQKISRMLNRPEYWDFTGADALYAGVDLGTFKAAVIVVDEKGEPRAAKMRRAEIARSGMILDYMGALTIVREMMAEIRFHSEKPIDKGATSYPPKTDLGNIETSKYILEGSGLEVLQVLDEPTAANLVLNIRNGAIVDVGGGTTGVAVFRNGDVVYSNDEATGGLHLSLVLAGSLKISYEEAEEIKSDRKRTGVIFPIVRPVIEKISSIVSGYLKEFDGMEEVCLVGGTCELDGLTEVVGRNLGLTTYRPEVPQVVTPFGIALSCLGGNGHGPHQ